MRSRALAWLAQREHSRKELGLKLARWLSSEAGDDGPTTAAQASEIERLLDALQAAGHLSDARFVESRVHARRSRFGNRRIELELSQHGLRLGDDERRRLAADEAQRAIRLCQARYGAAPVDAAARARQARFLAGRGFGTEAIRAALTGSTSTHFEDSGDGHPVDGTQRHTEASPTKADSPQER